MALAGNAGSIDRRNAVYQSIGTGVRRHLKAIGRAAAAGELFGGSGPGATFDDLPSSVSLICSTERLGNHLPSQR